MRLVVFYITLLFTFSGILLVSGQYRREISRNKEADSSMVKKSLRKVGLSQNKLLHISQPLYAVQKPVSQDNNKEAAFVSRVDVIRDAGLNLKGEGFGIAMWESGNPITTHSDFQDTQTTPQTRIQQLGSTIVEKAHATRVAGTMVSNGSGNNDAKGMAPKAIVRSYSNSSHSNRIADYINELDTEISSNQSLIANNSWDFYSGYYNNGTNRWGEASGANYYGMTEDYIFGFYSSFDLAIDELLNRTANEHYTVIFSSGNDKNEYYGITGPNSQPYPKDCNSGYDCMAWSHGGKNIITVGAVNQTVVVDSASDITLGSYAGTEFSSVGPMDDGRIKPDLVAVGTNMFTTDTTAGGYSTASSTNGTSYSAPVVSGGSLLIQEHAQNTVGQTLYGFTLKGLLCNTAGELGDYIGPDYRFGWGVFDAKGAADFISNVNTSTFMLDGGVLSNGETVTQYFMPNLDRVTATLSWYDPEGTPVYDWSYAITNTEAQSLLLNNRTSMLVNDLDLRVENNGIEYEPWILDPTNPANPAVRGDNTVDNVEEVYIHTDELKHSAIKVTVSHKGTLQDGLEEHYALLINGVQECNVYSVKKGQTSPTWNFDDSNNEMIPDGTDGCLVIGVPTYTITADTAFTSTLFSIPKGTTLTIESGNTLTINGQLDVVGNIVVQPTANLKVQ